MLMAIPWEIVMYETPNIPKKGEWCYGLLTALNQ